ncbi:extensin family protein [Ancylobacter pratisalsi]|uniref:Extensin family protein n=1 Tax=Ancylobacter pratisalsi TaxID=1745854 RepID=A0A6P1YJX1_9HYPH|nr:extensin family protein [Ancylobacter pratisalsi]QIB33462.1 extensin family protein [Ancylobacter pratisalsi]
MTRGVSWFLVAPLVLLGLSGCKFGLEQREPWRTEAEERCLAGGLVKPSAYTVPVKEIEGAGSCGMEHPFRVLAFNEGAVEVSPKATLACPITASVDRWLLEDIQPAAMAWFGQPVATVKQMSSYSCRNMNGGPSGKISEHAFGNAFDIGGFVLADGRIILVKTGWKGSADERGFLRTVQFTACKRFSTVLGPGSNVYHYDHIHVDLMRRASGHMACNPKVTPPAPPNLPVYKAPPMASPSYKAPLSPAPWNARPMVAAPAAVTPVADETSADEGYAPDNAAIFSSAPIATTPLPRAPASGPRPVAAAAAPVPLAAPGAPMALTPGRSAPPPAYGHGVDPNYRSPTPNYGAPPQPAPIQPAPAQPAGYPASPYPTQGYPAPASNYPAPNAYPSARPAAPPATSRPPGIPLPPAGIPLAKWLGLDTTATGSIETAKAGEGTAPTGNVRSFTAERQFASPIPVPEAEAGAD